MMEAARTSETLVNFYQTTWHYNPEDSHQGKQCLSLDNEVFHTTVRLPPKLLERQINQCSGKRKEIRTFWEGLHQTGLHIVTVGSRMLTWCVFTVRITHNNCVYSWGWQLASSCLQCSLRIMLTLRTLGQTYHSCSTALQGPVHSY
jgi:hypothetical protein